MSNKKELQTISASEAAKLGVSALSVRPNDASRYGQGGLSATALQAWFDNLPKLVATKFNEIAMTLASSDAAKYIGIDALGVDNLYDLLLLFGERGTGINDRNISDYIKTLYTPEGAVAAVSIPIKDIVQDLVRRIVSASAGHVVSGSFDDVKGEILLKLASGEDIVIPFDVLADLKERSDKAFSEASLDKSNQLVLSSPDGSQKKVDLSPLAFGEAARVEIEKLKETDASFERRLTNLEEQISDDYFVTDDAVAYEKIVPARACTYAKLDSIGGMTYKCDNLLDYRKFNATYTEAGVTLTNNGDGTLTFSGTLGADFSYSSIFPIFEGECYIPAGTYTLSGFSELPAVAFSEFWWEYASGETGGTSGLGAVTFTENVVALHLSIILEGMAEETTTFSTTLTPMLNEGSVALPFEPFFEGLRDTKVTEIKNYGANLLPYPYASTTATYNGLTFTDNGDGTITLNGTLNGSAEFIFSKSLSLEDGKKYSYKDIDSGLSAMLTYRDETGTQKWASGNVVWKSAYKFLQLYLYFGSSREFDNVVFKPMLNYGDVAAPYKPYRAEPISIPIPAEIQAINTGKGIKGYADTIDFEDGKKIQRVETVALDGTLTWYKHQDAGDYWGFYSLKSYFSKPMSSDPFTPYLCSAFAVETWESAKEAEFAWYSGASFGIFVKKTRLPNYANLATNDEKIAAFKAYLAEQYANGNPIEITYLLETPIVTDISAKVKDFDNIIEVEAGGRLEFVNEHKKAVPSSITYLLKEESSK